MVYELVLFAFMILNLNDSPILTHLWNPFNYPLQAQGLNKYFLQTKLQTNCNPDHSIELYRELEY